MRVAPNDDDTGIGGQGQPVTGPSVQDVPEGPQGGGQGQADRPAGGPLGDGRDDAVPGMVIDPGDYLGFARAADTAPWPSLSLALRSGRASAGRLARKADSGAAEDQAVT